jgi:NAD+ synthase (glutamine-hydrolysing)
LAQASQFTLKPVDVITATVSLEDVRSYRSSASRNLQVRMTVNPERWQLHTNKDLQGAAQAEFPRVECDLWLGQPAEELYLSDTFTVTKPMELKVLDPMVRPYP